MPTFRKQNHVACPHCTSSVSAQVLQKQKRKTKKKKSHSDSGTGGGSGGRHSGGGSGGRLATVNSVMVVVAEWWPWEWCGGVSGGSSYSSGSGSSVAA